MSTMRGRRSGVNARAANAISSEMRSRIWYLPLQMSWRMANRVTDSAHITLDSESKKTTAGISSAASASTAMRKHSCSVGITIGSASLLKCSARFIGGSRDARAIEQAFYKFKTGLKFGTHWEGWALRVGLPIFLEGVEVWG